MKFIKTKIKWILVFLGIVGIAVASQIGGELLTEQPLTEVGIVRTITDIKYAHVFIGKQGKFEVEITEEEYKALGIKDAGQPTYEDATWYNSYGGREIYTLTPPVLEDYQFFDDRHSSSTVWVKLPKLSAKELDKSFIIENKITEEGIEELEKGEPISFIKKAEAALAYSDASDGGTTTGDSTTYAHTVTGANTVLIVSAGSRAADETIDSITFNADALTEEISLFSTPPIKIFFRIAPDDGTHNVVVTLSKAADYLSSGAISFTGADQTDPIGGTASDAMVTQNPSLEITTESADSIIVDIVNILKNAVSLTVGADQTERWSRNDGDGPKAQAGSTEDSSGIGVHTMSWSFTEDSTEANMGAVEVLPSAAAPPAEEPDLIQVQTTGDW